MTQGLVRRLRAWLAPPRVSVPLRVAAMERPDKQVEALFRASFGTGPPDFPMHYVARWHRDGSVRAYLHYTVHEPGVYLCGGLCVDARLYRQLPVAERATLREAGSLSRWLLRESIAALPGKRAVFAYTGNAASLRDGLALGFTPTPHRHLIVQWHGATRGERAAIESRVAALGPF
jgi:hypothetical protein